LNVRLPPAYAGVSLAFLANRLRVCWSLNQTQPPPSGDGATLGVNLLRGWSYPASGDYRHPGMLAMLRQAAKLYSSPGSCDVWLNRRVQGNRPCCTVTNHPITLSRRPYWQTWLVNGYPYRKGRLAGNSKWSGGWPPSGPLNFLAAGRPAVVRLRPRAAVRSLNPLPRLL
jgi:hypothetical protein